VTTFQRFLPILHPCFLVDECLDVFDLVPPQNHCLLAILSLPILVSSSPIFQGFTEGHLQFAKTQQMECLVVKSFSVSSATTLGSCLQTRRQGRRTLVE
jgi:hypothetical protein